MISLISIECIFHPFPFFWFNPFYFLFFFQFSYFFWFFYLMISCVTSSFIVWKIILSIFILFCSGFLFSYDLLHLSSYSFLLNGLWHDCVWVNPRKEKRNIQSGEEEKEKHWQNDNKTQKYEIFHLFYVFFEFTFVFVSCHVPTLVYVYIFTYVYVRVYRTTSLLLPCTIYVITHPSANFFFRIIIFLFICTTILFSLFCHRRGCHVEIIPFETSLGWHIEVKKYTSRLVTTYTWHLFMWIMKVSATTKNEFDRATGW